MPFKIGNYVMTGSRGVLLKKVTPLPKDTIERTLGGSDRPRARNGIGWLAQLPAVTVKRVSFETRFASDLSIRRAVARMNPMRDACEMGAAVQSHIKHQLSLVAEPLRLMPLLIVIGEVHCTKASMIMNIAAMAAVQNGARPTYLVEHTAEVVAGPLRRDFDDLQAEMQSTPPQDLDCDLKQFAEEIGEDTFKTEVAKGLVARNSGFDVQGFDYNEADYSRREAGMLANIEACLRAGPGPFIVSTGNFHVPAIHKRFAATNECCVISMAMMNAETWGDPDVRRIRSQLLARPEVLKVPMSHTIENAPFNFMQFARQVGLVLSQ